MSDKFDIHDEDGHKIGTAKRQLSPYEQGQIAGRQLAGAALLIHLFWKPLLTITIILSLLALPCMIISGIGRVAIILTNPTLEQKFTKEIKTTIEPGLDLLSNS